MGLRDTQTHKRHVAQANKITGNEIKADLAGKSTLKSWQLCLVQSSLTPQSPDADKMVMPRTHAAQKETNLS